MRSKIEAMTHFGRLFRAGKISRKIFHQAMREISSY